MKTSSSVRRPSLSTKGRKNGDNSVKPVGEILRQAKNDLIFSRWVIAILVVLLVTAIVAFVTLGYFNQLVDYFLAFVE